MVGLGRVCDPFRRAARYFCDHRRQVHAAIRRPCHRHPQPVASFSSSWGAWGEGGREEEDSCQGEEAATASRGPRLPRGDPAAVQVRRLEAALRQDPSLGGQGVKELCRQCKVPRTGPKYKIQAALLEHAEKAAFASRHDATSPEGAITLMIAALPFGRALQRFGKVPKSRRRAALAPRARRGRGDGRGHLPGHHRPQLRAVQRRPRGRGHPCQRGRRRPRAMRGGW